MIIRVDPLLDLIRVKDGKAIKETGAFFDCLRASLCWRFRNRERGGFRVASCGFLLISGYSPEFLMAMNASSAISMVSAMSSSVSEALMKWLWWLVKNTPRLTHSAIHA